MEKRLGAIAASVIVGLGLIAPQALADSGVTLTSQQLTASGFPKKPNVVNWAPGTARLSTNTADQWQDITVTGKAPNFTPPGQLLSLQRFTATDTQGSGEFKDLNITTNVNPNGTFAMRMQLGYVGTYGYRIGYLTDSFSPEFVGFEFQLTIKGTGQGAKGGSATAVNLTSKQLARAGFTTTPNVNAWAGTASLSTNRAPAGTPITIRGTATAPIEPGSVLQLTRFVASDKAGSGHFEDLPARTTVKSDGTFELSFEVNQKGTYGYSLTTPVSPSEPALIEFQITTT
jgi:hypothetical protein